MPRVYHMQRFALLLISLFLSIPIICSGDAYLDQLEAESANTGDVSNSDGKAAALGDRLPNGLSKPDFEQNLQRNFKTTYHFYLQLTADQQQEVYILYGTSPEFKDLRRFITKLYVQ